MPLLAKRLHLTGARVTRDAMGIPATTAKAVLARCADGAMAVRGNQRRLAAEVAPDFGTPGQRFPEPFRTIDADRRRTGTRRHRFSPDAALRNRDRRAPGEPRFSGLKAIAKVRAIIGGWRPHHHPAPRLPRLAFLHASLLARAHPGIGTRLNRVRDVVFHDVPVRPGTDNGIGIMSDVRPAAAIPLHASGGKQGLKVRRRAAARDLGDLRAVVTRSAR